MTEAEKWRTLAQVLAVTVPVGAMIGSGLGWLNGGVGASMAAGAVIGLLITSGIGTFNVSWSVGLIPRRWRDAPFLVVLLTRSLVWLSVIVVAVSLPLLTVAGLSFEDLVDQQFVISVAASFAAALLFNFLGQINGLLGRGVLVGLILGRYHRPREEVLPAHRPARIHTDRHTARQPALSRLPEPVRQRRLRQRRAAPRRGAPLRR